jgi:hypothetical protein
MAAQQREIDWADAEVKGGDVVLPLAGEASKAWSERFKGVLALLAKAGAGWGAITVTKKAIKVSGLQPGSEDDLRHLLESVVAEVNSELQPTERDDPGEVQDPQAARDEEMAGTLRLFAERADG